jgi:hypothetical protein
MSSPLTILVNGEVDTAGPPKSIDRVRVLILRGQVYDARLPHSQFWFHRAGTGGRRAAY